MHVYVFEYIVSINYRTAEWMFTKLGRDEVLVALHMHKAKEKYRGVFCHICPGAYPGWGKIGHGGPFLKQLLLQTGRLQQQTELIAMI